MSDNVMHDSPTEFLHEVTQTTGVCAAQSVIPREDDYLCACSCGQWQTSAPTRQEGLRLARLHTASE